MSYSITLAGTEVQLTGAGLVWIPRLRLLAAADIHLGKGSFFRRFATLLPPYDSAETLERLERAVAQYRPDIFIALGDSFHDAAAAERMDEALSDRLNALIARVREWRWVLGNHDPVIGAAIAGMRCGEVEIGGIAFRHETDPESRGAELSGHYHPKAGVTLAGMRITTPCFVQSGDRLILPAFGGYTGGLSVDHPELLRAMPERGRKIYLAHRGQVYAI